MTQKILYITPQPFYQERGTCMATLMMLRALSALGHKVDLLTYSGGADIAIENLTIYRVRTFPLLKNVAIGFSLKKIYFDVFLLFRIGAQLIKSRYDVIHANEEAAFIVGIFRKFMPGKFIYDMDSVLSDQLQEAGLLKSKLLKSVVEFFQKLTIRQADATVTVCASISERVRSIWPQTKIFQIEDIPLVEFHEEQPQGPSTLTDDVRFRGKKIIMYIGNLQSYQGVDELIRSIPLIKDDSGFLFVVVGGDPLRIEELKVLADSLRVTNRLIFTGNEPFDRIPAFMNAATILVSPRNRGSNTPFKIYEYLKSGKPIVATDLPTHTQVLNKDIAILVKPAARDIAAGINSLLSDESLRLRIGQAGKRFVEEHYSKEEFIRKVGSLYEYMENSQARS